MLAPVDLGTLHGRIDRIEDGLITGWARNERYPDARVFLDILVDGRKAMQVLADEFRSDLLRAGIGDGQHAFQARLPAVSSFGEITMRRSADQTPLRLSPDAVKAEAKRAGRLAA